jgi:hypothetical protein
MYSWFLFIIVSLISFGAYAFLRYRYNKYNQIDANSGYTGAEIAEKILQRYAIHDVTIHSSPDHLSDHYDPLNKRLVLSELNYNGRSLSAIGVSAHEAGHAIQHKEAYAPLQLRMSVVGITNIASGATTWIMMGCMFFHLIKPDTGILLLSICFGIIMFFQLITLPVEFDASARAKRILIEIGAVTTGEEYNGMSKVLNAAALTYVGAFISSLLNLVYYLSLLSSDRRDNE